MVRSRGELKVESFHWTSEKSSKYKETTETTAIHILSAKKTFCQAMSGFSELAGKANEVCEGKPFPQFHPLFLPFLLSTSHTFQPLTRLCRSASQFL